MPLFDIPKRANRQADKKVASKSKTMATVMPAVKGGDGVLGRINQIKAMVERNLGKYKDEYIVIREEEVLHDYITECIGNGYISIDTETDGLDPLQNKLAGICPYTRGQKGAYIPLNHISYITGTKVPNQLSEEFVIKEFERLLAKRPEIDMFNAPFDIRFLRAAGLTDIYSTWDGYLATRLLNENEPDNALKLLHNKYCLNGKGDAFKFDDLFKGIPFTYIPINTGYLYAAHDPVITTELCDYQRQYLYEDNPRDDMKAIYWVFKNIEMPCVNVVADMEDIGVAFDMNYQQELSVKYNQLLKDKETEVHKAISVYDNKIEAWKKTNNSDDGPKLENPINIGSPAQLAILLYDIIGVKAVDKKKPRGTGEDILEKIKEPESARVICQSILQFRELSKLVSTYIDKLPNCVNKDGRIHCNFNQYGADTGRFSSKEPNLQNIPSHNKEIRKMFVASPGYLLMSSDFSQQEPKCLAALCRKHGDPQMYETFMQGKDLYSEIASKAFNVPYEDCREFREDGTTNKQGKERRTQAKSILLGVLYGRGEASIAEQLKCTTKKAKEIKESVFKGFPAIKQFEEDSLQMARDIGYVTTVCGRKRRLPDLQLPEYEFEWKDGVAPDSDLLDFDMDEEVSNEVPDDVIDYYWDKLDRAWFKDKQKIKQEAWEEGIKIIDNGGKIADATRQCVNARIQGSAADLTKLAMIDLGNDERLKELGFRLLIPVHDEVIAECPQENIKECSERLASIMSHAAEKILEMPIKCDVEITKQWYGLPFAVSDFYDENGNLKPEEEWAKNKK